MLKQVVINFDRGFVLHLLEAAINDMFFMQLW